MNPNKECLACLRCTAMVVTNTPRSLPALRLLDGCSTHRRSDAALLGQLDGSDWIDEGNTYTVLEEDEPEVDVRNLAPAGTWAGKGSHITPDWITGRKAGQDFNPPAARPARVPKKGAPTA